jgi:hypothetical protein
MIESFAWSSGKVAIARRTAAFMPRAAASDQLPARSVFGSSHQATPTTLSK